MIGSDRGNKKTYVKCKRLTVIWDIYIS